MKFPLFLFLMMGLTQSVSADVYQCTGSDGSISFSDKPCGFSADSKETLNRVISNDELKSWSNTDVAPPPPPEEEEEAPAQDEQEEETLEKEAKPENPTSQLIKPPQVNNSNGGYVSFYYSSVKQVVSAAWAEIQGEANRHAHTACLKSSRQKPCKLVETQFYPNPAPRRICLAIVMQYSAPDKTHFMKTAVDRSEAQERAKAAAQCEEPCWTRLEYTQCADVQKVKKPWRSKF